jgi:hypothetical protein
MLTAHVINSSWDELAKHSLVVANDLIADGHAGSARLIVQALAVAPAELPEDVARHGSVAPQLTQPAVVALPHACDSTLHHRSCLTEEEQTQHARHMQLKRDRRL